MQSDFQGKIERPPGARGATRLILIIGEATGGYGHRLLAALPETQVPVALVNSRRVRDSARATSTIKKFSLDLTFRFV